MHIGMHARVRVGEHELALPAAAVVRALPMPADAPVLPRRGGALTTCCPSPWGMLPVVELGLWLRLGESGTAAARHRGQVLVVREGDRLVGVRVDEMRGVHAVRSVQRLHHDEDPEQLFQCAVQWNDGSAAALLEVERLMRLAVAWREEASVDLPRAMSKTADAARVTTRTPHALFSAGGHRWAIAADQLQEVVPAPAPEYSFPGGAGVRGICQWQGRKLPMLELATLARPGAGASEIKGDLMAVASNGVLCVGVIVDAVEHLVLLPGRLDTGDMADRFEPHRPFEPVLVEGLGTVLRVDMAGVLQRLPEAEISRQLAPRRALHPPSLATRADSVAYLLFEADATYAAPVAPVVQLVALDAALARELADGGVHALTFRDTVIPLVALPSFSGLPSPLPTIALIVEVAPRSHVAVAVHRVNGWADRQGVEPGGLRTAALGDLRLVTVVQGSRRSSHIVVDLQEVAQVLA